MKIVLEHIGRRFNREWIFRGIDFSFESGGSYAVLGPNGAGKSTLLQLIAGSLGSSEGNIHYYNAAKIADESVYRQISIATPYLEMIEEFTLSEMIDFHFSFKSCRDKLDKKSIINILGFEKSKNKALKYFSSGMKQRTKLALAFCSDTPVLLLDEPTANLDQQGIDWYKDLVQHFTPDRTIIVCSNQPHEYDFCSSALNVMAYK